MKIEEYLDGCIYNWVSRDLLNMEFTDEEISEALGDGLLTELTDSYDSFGEHVFVIKKSI